MPTLIRQPIIIKAAGNKPKQIEEFAGHVNSGHDTVSAARMISPEGWCEPGQRPEFEEITVVLRGMVRVEHETGVIDVRAGHAAVMHPGEWVRYSSPEPGGARIHRSGYARVFLPQASIAIAIEWEHLGVRGALPSGVAVQQASHLTL